MGHLVTEALNDDNVAIALPRRTLETLELLMSSLRKNNGSSCPSKVPMNFNRREAACIVPSET